MRIFTGTTPHVIPGRVAALQLLHQDADTWQAVAEAPPESRSNHRHPVLWGQADPSGTLGPVVTQRSCCHQSCASPWTLCRAGLLTQ